MLDQTAMPLVSQLRESADRDYAPFHTPGHKRGGSISPALADWWGNRILQADLPELPELDNLFAPQGVIRDAQALAAVAFGADRTWFLANGSTAGILAAILATCGPGDTLILPRNIHQSVISGLILSGANPIFIAPEFDGTLAHCVTPTAVATALAAHPNAKAILIVSPTYYGVAGNITEIAALAHGHNIPLLVDEAHGAHFAFHPDLPTSALAAGADLVVQSTHKTLSALTQASMLHLQGQRVDADRIAQALQLVQSTSPSYLLLASLDAARHHMANQGKTLMTRALAMADRARAGLTTIPGLTLLNPTITPGFHQFDRTRLTLFLNGLDGFAADQLLHEQLGVTCELPSLHHLTFIITAGNTDRDIDRLIDACEQLGRSDHLPPAISERIPFYNDFEQRLTPREAFFGVGERVPIGQTPGRISAELVCPYPPGIPVLMPGEVVTPSAITYLQQVLAAGGTLSGCADDTLATLKVLHR
jgi:arginine decarboxylase